MKTNKTLLQSLLLYIIRELPDQEATSQYFQEKYKRLKKDEKGNLYHFIDKTPLLNAHLDNVGSKEAHKNLHNVKIENGIVKGTHNIGADDKCWLAFIDYVLTVNWLIDDNPDYSILLTVQEETGMGWSSYAIKTHKKQIEDCNFTVLLDRRNSWDIIQYCDTDLLSDIQDIAKDYNYKVTEWSLSDLDNLCWLCPWVNLSCWYYNPHTNTEYIKWDEYVNAVEFATHILDDLYYNEDYKTYTRDFWYNYNYWYNYKTYDRDTKTRTYWKNNQKQNDTSKFDFDDETIDIKQSITLYDEYNDNWVYIKQWTYTIIG